MPTGFAPDRQRAIVFVVDDDAALRDALGRLLRSAAWRVKTFASGVEFLEQPWPETPACLVLDIHLPGVSGLELQRMLAERGDRRPIIFVTGHGDIATTVRAMKAGAVEFLPKPFRAAALLEAVEQAVLRDAEAQVERGRRVEIRRRHATLSPRERQVMLLTVSGLINKQVAARLDITEATVKVHRGRVMQKMGAGSLPELVRMADIESVAAPVAAAP